MPGIESIRVKATMDLPSIFRWGRTGYGEMLSKGVSAKQDWVIINLGVGRRRYFETHSQKLFVLRLLGLELCPRLQFANLNILWQRSVGIPVLPYLECLVVNPVRTTDGSVAIE